MGPPMFHSWSIALLLSYCITFSSIVSSMSGNCTKGRVTFERTPGLRLPSEDLVVFGPLELLPKTAPTACYRKCLESNNCEGYFIDHVDQKCILVREDSQNVSLEGPLQHSSGWSYHRKICLDDAPCHRQWSFDRIPGVQLFGYDDKPLSNIESRDVCLEKCNIEDSFVCRSARYDRLKNTCVLSRHDRRTAPEAFRKSLRQVEYLENQCVTEPSRCMFHQQSGRTLVQGGHVHVQGSAVTREECEQACVNHSDFTCRSFEFDPGSNLCLLSPDDSYSITEGLRPPNAQGRYFYERGSCIEVHMHCEATSMTAIVKVITPFRGRLYALGHPYECYAVSVRANGEVALTMPLHGRTCGTKNLGNGTFVNSVVVQHHPFVLRSTDRRIDVACDYEEVQRKLRGGKQVLEGDLQSLTQVITGLAATPPVRLRVVNASGYEVRGVELGEQLYLKVEMLDESVFGIFGSGLLARSGMGTETVMLIDDRGCPVEPAIFPALEKSGDSKSLVAPFQAFKFASESTVKFQLTVSFCLDVCTPVRCEDEGTKEVHQSYGRRKRSRDLSDTQSLELQSGDVVTDITMETPLFVVSSGKHPQSSEMSNQRKFTTTSEGIEAIQLTEMGLCLTRPVLYTAVLVGSVAQVVFFGLCILFLVFVRKARRMTGQPIGYMSSRGSVSSKQELCASS
ncbi:uncharacterized protein LOC129966174 isoform X2 [Argiope bruennichi]|uniref:uncharacterized protein LOC129966174 isoform X2 n=1 Tax=Argiope bruennichi TaxID=94029 RepID=UPI002494C8CC|nr:uncharacterized protein LOC129966174 isoform X2 [Argiope bruennichi]